MIKATSQEDAPCNAVEERGGGGEMGGGEMSSKSLECATEERGVLY